MECVQRRVTKATYALKDMSMKRDQEDQVQKLTKPGENGAT